LGPFCRFPKRLLKCRSAASFALAITICVRDGKFTEANEYTLAEAVIRHRWSGPYCS
jgi:hypothetical protein